MKTVEEALLLLTSRWQEDDDYFHSWQANIAMEYQDEGERQGSKDSKVKRHAIANQAAKNFLSRLIKSCQQERTDS